MKKIPRRTAVTAALATVGGMVMPLLGAGAAQAATAPTQVGVTPTAAYTTAGSPFTFDVTLDNPVIAPNSVYADVYSGPDAIAGAPYQGIPCSGTGLAYTCTIAAASVGTDSIHFYYGGATYTPASPHADGTLTVAGAPTTFAVTPATSHVAQGVYSPYTVMVTDAQGRPVAGQSVTIAVAQANATSGDLSVTGTDPANAWTGANGPTAGGNGTATATVTTGDGSANSPAGAATFYAASKVAGTVGIKAYMGATAPTTNSATETVDPGTANDVTSVTLSPASQTAYAGSTVTVNATMKNAQGDTVGGITPQASVISGPSQGATTTATQSDGTGVSTVTYDASNVTGTDTLQVWVDQTTGAGTSGVLDPGEPNAKATATLVAYNLANYNVTPSTDPVKVPAGTHTSSATFTVTDGNGQPASGVTVTFALPNGTTKDAPYTIAPANAVTDAKGQVSVSVTDANAAAGDNVVVTASLPTNPSGTTPKGTVTFEWQNPTVTTVTVTPASASSPIDGTSAKFSVTAADQFGKPLAIQSYAWTVLGPRNTPATNVTATGTGATFSYTDNGPANTPGSDTVQVTVTTAIGTGEGTATQYWIVGSGQATSANIDLTSANTKSSADYVTPAGDICQPSNTPQTCTAHGFTGTDSISTGDIERTSVGLVDAYGNQLEGKTVTLTSTGVGQFVDAAGNPIGKTTTATVEDGTGNYWAMAVANVTSTQGGTQNIVATVDGQTATATVTYTASGYTAITPERVVDTRIGQGSVGSGTAGLTPPPNGRLAPNTPYFFGLSNTDLYPYGDAYAFNVTAIHPNGAGNLRIGPACYYGYGSNVPSTSLINYQVGKDIANFVVVPSTYFSRCEYNPYGAGFVLYSDGASTAVTIDALGYYNGGVEPLSSGPTRVADTRLGGGTIAAGSSRAFQVAGTSGIPSNATAVALNVTAVGPTGVGNLRVYPDGSTVPNSSSINYIKGVDKAAFVIAKLGANGKVDVYSDGSAVNVVLDAFEYYTSADSVGTVTQAPVRILDTRTTGPGTTLNANTPFSFPVAGQGNVPADAQAVLATVTAIHTADSTGYGNLRVYPAGMATPTVSTINYVSKTSDVANFVIVPIGKNGEVTLYSDGSPIDVAFDVVGWIPAGVPLS